MVACSKFGNPVQSSEIYLSNKNKNSELRAGCPILRHATLLTRHRSDVNAIGLGRGERDICMTS